MLEPEIPKNETQRLKALQGYGILDSLAESDYDDITRLASVISGKKIALISLIDENRQWFKSKFGLDAPQTDRSISFCGHAINTPNEPFVIKDSTLDARFADNPLVTGDPHVIFYAGIPLVDEDDFALGTLCVIDDKPGDLSDQQMESLQILSKSVLNLLKLRKQNHKLKERENDLSKALELNNHFFMVLNESGEIESTSDLFRKVIPELELGRKFTDFCAWDARFQFDKWRLSGALKTSNLLFFDSLHHRQRFKYSLLKIGEKIFLSATPVINSDYSLTNYSLSMSDFSPHDYIVEFLFLQQTSEITMKDAQKALEYLVEKNEELIQLNRQNEILSRFPNENPNPVVRFDYELRTKFWNEASEKSFLKDFKITNETLGDKELNHEMKQLIEGDKNSSSITLERNGNAYTINIINIKHAEYLNIYVSDVTKFADEKRSLKTFYEKILDYFPVDIGVFDKEHNYLYVNRAGIKNEEVRTFMIGKTDYDYCDFRNLPYDLADFRRKKFTKAIETRQTVYWTDEYLLEDGSYKYIERRFSPIYIDNSEVSFVVGYGVDITEIKNSQKDVESKNQIISEINLNLEKIIEQKTSQNQELTNTISNLDKMAMIGELTANITHDLNTPIGSIKAASESIAYMLKSLYTETLEHCTQEQLNWVINRSVQKLNLSVGGLQSLKEKAEWNHVFEDVLNYQKSDKDQIIDGLVRCRINPSEIDTVQYILKQPNTEKFLDLIYNTLVILIFNESILTSSDKAADVIKNLRFYIKEGSKENREEIMVEESVRTVLKVFQHELNKGISVHIDADPSIRIFSYQSKIYQLWSNIIKNALDAMEGSGNLFVNISGDDREVKVIISNDGPKIPEDILPKIFNKFYTTKDSSTGTGLGLNIVKEIMDVNKGSVSVSSDESLTSFTFIFKN